MTQPRDNKGRFIKQTNSKSTKTKCCKCGNNVDTFKCHYYSDDGGTVTNGYLCTKCEDKLYKQFEREMDGLLKKVKFPDHLFKQNLFNNRSMFGRMLFG